MQRCRAHLVALARRQYLCWLVPQLTRVLSCSASTCSFRCAYKAKNWIDSKKAKDEPIEAEATEVVETDEE